MDRKHRSVRKHWVDGKHWSNWIYGRHWKRLDGNRSYGSDGSAWCKFYGDGSYGSYGQRRIWI